MMTDKTKTPQKIFLLENYGKQEYGIKQNDNILGMVRYFRCDEDYNKIKRVLAIALMSFLDNNRPEGKMCLSNGECKNIEDAFTLGDWDMIFRYIEKYINRPITELVEEPETSVWHDNKDTPVASKTKIVLYTNGKCDLFKAYKSDNDFDNYWASVNQSLEEKGVLVKHWAYVDDLLTLSNLETTEKERKCMYSKDDYTDEDRKVLCDGCKEGCKYSKSDDFTIALAECIHQAQGRVVDPLVLAETWKDELIKLAKSEEHVSEDLEDYINEISKQFPEVSFAKLSRIAVRVAKWQKEHLWKPADGDDLPEYDREVIAILDYDFGHYKVVYAHRPNPNGWNGTNIDTEEKEHFEPVIYGKGGWNQPHVLYWLDAKLPYEENKIIK